MGPELKKLVISPIGMGPLLEKSGSAQGENPVCGDKLSIEVLVLAGEIHALGFRAVACPACIAVASCAAVVYGAGEPPQGPPYPVLRGEVERRGGLGRFERHALDLVEDVLGRAFAK